jgi:hypothetical protein
MRTAPSDTFPANAVLFEEAKAAQSDGGSFKFSLCASTKVPLMVT